ncbi:MAG TPA: response regulator transcription factor [Candidatus Limnocylindria bacterium]|nr:response regulator transcription factor [Candidatus Limnocylindria bacterium]
MQLIRVLSVSADQALARSIDLTLSRRRYVHRSEGTAQAAKAAISGWRPHLVLLDLDIEAGAGIQLIDEARSCVRIGVIALTRRGDLHQQLDVYARGIDDYVRVPFVREDLAARIGAVLRRTHEDAGVPRVLFGDLEIDVLNRRVLTGERELHLTSLEQALLYLLAANAGDVLSRDQILDALWGADCAVESNSVERHVRALRAKLHDDWREPRYIETVRGVGYRLVPAPDAVPC